MDTAEAVASNAGNNIMETSQRTIGSPTIDTHLKISGLLVSAGMATEAISLNWAHPTSFFLFMMVGGALIGAGILLFFYSLIK
jgi:hypothetical protein